MDFRFDINLQFEKLMVKFILGGEGLMNAYYNALVTNAGFSKYYKNLTHSLENFNFISLPNETQEREYFLKNEIDIVLLHIDGCIAAIELLKYFKSTKPAVPVIIVSDNSCEPLLIRFFRYGAWDYFRNPIDFDELSQRIRKVLELKEGAVKNEFEDLPNGLAKAIGYINKNYTLDLRLSQVAGLAGMSVSTFGRAFKGKMESTFVCYVNNLRIFKAIDLLSDEGLSISDVAFACGFTNQYSFSRTFKKITKKSPTSFRKALIN